MTPREALVSPGARRALPRAAPAGFRAMLGDDLWELTRQRGVPLAAADQVTAVASEAVPRASFRLRFQDGALFKGRRLESAAQARTVERLVRRANPCHFAGVVARRRAALLEEWRPGLRLDSPRVSCRWIEAAGEALGELHVASAGRFGRIRSHHAVVSTLVRVERRLRDLCERALLGPDEASRMLEAARTWAPARAATGLVHCDYCGENLVLSKGSVVAIDNESLGVGALDYDLARTWTRWSLGVAQARALYRGYGRHRSPAAFECHLPFWAMAALADSACFRARAGSPARSGTMARLRRLTERAAERSGQTWSLMDWPSARALDP